MDTYSCTVRTRILTIYKHAFIESKDFAKKIAKSLVDKNKRHTFAPTRTPKPLHDAQIGGRFIFYPMVTFSKTFTSANKIVELLNNRGLVFPNKTLAEQYLVNIGYYRLSAYLYPYLSSPKTAQRFKPQS